MLNKLSDIEEKYAEIERLISDPATVSNPVEYAKLMKEYKRQAPIIEAYRNYTKILADAEDARILMDDTDADLAALAEAEYFDKKKKLDALEQELKALLLPRSPDDDKNVIIEIRAGAGGEEAALFVADLYRMYTMYTETAGFKTEPINKNETELGGIKEISFMVIGDGAFSRFKFESGVHRVQRVPETESQGRIHTSTVTVAVLPEADDVEVEINPADLKIETCKSSGAGGQHINKTESAIRIIHKPTGIIVECQEERSQFKNRDKALKMLKSKLLDIKQREQADAIASARRSQVGTGDRSERIRTYNYHESRVTDHRIGLTLYSLESFLNGDIGKMIDELTAADTAARLQGETE